ncbi:dihydroorotate dehydrogenase electron transfer subunit [Paenibacillus cisolokensis]|uniref:dihydroorotate dehydrogenase electron transfer subunit n=1 Tax=Paenibacillus cisolokensis TaxID=1658519 RepID=UPI003D28072C
MAKVLSNTPLAPGIYLLTVEGTYRARMGQFYMLRCWDSYPVLSRPISVHDISPESISFLYRAGGIGTHLLAKLQPGDSLQLEGPMGRGFPEPEGRTAIVGGGMGTAPMLLAARQLPEAQVFLGFKDAPFGVSPFQDIHSNVTVVSGGMIADHIDPACYDTILACGPVPMMEALAYKTEGSSAKLYVSVEKRMGCGIGACNSCAVTINGTVRKVCTDGPAFPAKEVNWIDLLSL